MAEDVQLWSVTASLNGTIDSACYWPEGQTRASVNNSARSMMAAHAKDRNLKNGSIVTAGTANAQTFLSGQAYGTLANVPTGLEVLLKIGPSLTSVDGTTTTLNVDGTGDVAIKNHRGEDVEAGLVAGAYAQFLYNGTNWIFLDSSSLTINNTVLITQVSVVSVADGGVPVAFLDFTNLDTTRYYKYQVICTNIKPEIDGMSLCLNVSTDNGATFPFTGVTDYHSAEVYHSQAQGYGVPGTVPASSWNQDDQGYLTISWYIDISVADRYPASVLLDLYNFQPGRTPSYNWRSTLYHPTVNWATMLDGSGYTVETLGCNAIRLWMTDGNILTGNFALYGVPI